MSQPTNQTHFRVIDDEGRIVWLPRVAASTDAIECADCGSYFTPATSWATPRSCPDCSTHVVTGGRYDASCSCGKRFGQGILPAIDSAANHAFAANRDGVA